MSTLAEVATDMVAAVADATEKVDATTENADVETMITKAAAAVAMRAVAAVINRP